MCDNDPLSYVSIFHTLDDYDNLVFLCDQRLLEAIDLHMDAYTSDKIDRLIMNYTHKQIMSDIQPLINDYVSILSNVSREKVNSIHVLEKYSIINESILKCIAHLLSAIYGKKRRIPRQYNSEFKLSNHVIAGPDTYAERSRIINDKISYLQTVPQPEQRTPEWYAFRHECITASSAWKVIDTLKQQENFITSKMHDNSNNRVEFGSNVGSPCHHGHKYEPLSTMLYEHVNRTKIGEFGCIKHKEYDFIGASPDGINIDPASEKFGTLLEIKNVVSREISSIPKKEYWTQMQMQMEVCDLDFCDFLETKFVQYDSEEEFLEDYSVDSTTKNVNNPTKVMSNNDGNYIGLIVMLYVNNSPVYEYCPLTLNTPEQVLVWKDELINKYFNDTLNSSWVDNIFWKCEKYSCICVERNRSWFSSVLPAFKSMWDVIQTRRAEQSHTDANAPSTEETKKKKRKIQTTTDMLNGNIGVCLIKLD